MISQVLSLFTEDGQKIEKHYTKTHMLVGIVVNTTQPSRLWTLTKKRYGEHEDESDNEESKEDEFEDGENEEDYIEVEFIGEDKAYEVIYL